MVNHDYQKKIQEIYDDRALISFDGGTNRETVKKDLDLVAVYFPDTLKSLLDVGCGSGWHLEHLYKSGYKLLTGIDLSCQSLKNFRERFETDIHLINDDFLTHIFQVKYDCIVNFHSCIGQFGELHDREFFKKVFDTLNPNGSFILTVFTIDKAANLEGTYNVKYSANSEISVTSDIVFDYEAKKLIISQTFSENSIEEEMKLYSSTEIIELLDAADFTDAKIIYGHSNYYSLFVGHRNI